LEYFEGAAGLDRDRVVLRVVRLDRLGEVGLCRALGVVVVETGEDLVEDLAAAHLVGVGRDQRVLRLGAVGEDDRGGVSGRISPTVVVRAAAAGEDQGARGDERQSSEAETSDFHYSSSGVRAHGK
jgi:hypothetical protein